MLSDKNRDQNIAVLAVSVTKEVQRTLDRFGFGISEFNDKSSRDAFSNL